MLHRSYCEGNKGEAVEEAQCLLSDLATYHSTIFSTSCKDGLLVVEHMLRDFRSLPSKTFCLIYKLALHHV